MCVCVCVSVCLSVCASVNVCARMSDYTYIYIYIGLMSRLLANGPGDHGSIPGLFIPRTQKMVT